MGMSKSVPCPNGVPAWPAVAAWLAANGTPARMRMIDGQLAFPDEEPPAEWRELRVALDGMMVTVRRIADSVEVVTWGTADDAVRGAGETIARAFATAS
jgi:hypothetical protein